MTASLSCNGCLHKVCDISLETRFVNKGQEMMFQTNHVKISTFTLNDVLKYPNAISLSHVPISLYKRELHTNHVLPISAKVIYLCDLFLP